MQVTPPDPNARILTLFCLDCCTQHHRDADDFTALLDGAQLPVYVTTHCPECSRLGRRATEHRCAIVDAKPGVLA